MSNKFLFLKSAQLNNILEKKLLNSLHYNKSIIRSSFFGLKPTFLADDYSSFDLLKEKKLKKMKKSAFLSFLGVSLNCKKFTYRHVLNKFLVFRINSYSLNVTSKKPIFFIKHLLHGFFSVKNKFKSLLVLKVKKGGYTVYALGFLGFMPRRQVKRFFFKFSKKFLKFFRQCRIKYSKQTTIYWNFIRKKNTKILMRLRFFVGTFSIYTFRKRKKRYYKLRKQINSFRKKKRLFPGSNIVFLVDKKKTKKVIYNSKKKNVLFKKNYRSDVSGKTI